MKYTQVASFQGAILVDGSIQLTKLAIPQFAIVAHPISGTDLQKGVSGSYVYTGYCIDADAEDAYFLIRIPANMTTLVSAKVCFVAITAVTGMRLDWAINAGADTEAYFIHSAASYGTVTTIANCNYELSILTELSAVTAGDIVCVRVFRPTTGNFNGWIKTLILEYR